MRTRYPESEPLTWEWLARQLARQIKLADRVRGRRRGQTHETFARILAERSSQPSDRQRPSRPPRMKERP